MEAMDEIKRDLQRHFTDGLAIVVGSGLSCAEGLSGMGELAAHLDSVLPERLDDDGKSKWATISRTVKEHGLEAALMKHEPSDDLDEAIVHGIVEKLGPEELAVLNEVVRGTRELRFSKLVHHLPKTGKGIPILTTNYDRLVETACEMAGLPVDTMFDGNVLARADPKEARNNLLRSASIHGRAIRIRYREHARIFKPHGSLDWYGTGDGPLRFGGDLNVRRLVVSPGKRKLRRGYDRPFADHREMMNRCLSEAARLLVVGYGFNDDHLETHLAELITRGAPTLILTRSLSDKAKTVAMAHPAVTAIERASDSACRIIRQKAEFTVDVPAIWDLGTFVDEVLRP